MKKQHKSNDFLWTRYKKSLQGPYPQSLRFLKTTQVAAFQFFCLTVGASAINRSHRVNYGKVLGVQWHPEKMYLYGDKESRADGEKLLKAWLRKEEEL